MVILNYSRQALILIGCERHSDNYHTWKNKNKNGFAAKPFSHYHPSFFVYVQHIWRLNGACYSVLQLFGSFIILEQRTFPCSSLRSFVGNRKKRKPRILGPYMHPSPEITTVSESANSCCSDPP